MEKLIVRLLLIIKVVGLTVFVFAFLAWFDGVIIQFTHPEWLPQRVSHLLNIRTDTFTIIMFFVSAFGFFLWRIVTEILKSETDKNEKT